MKTNIHFWSYLAQFFLRNKEKCFGQICRKNQDILCLITSTPKIAPFMR